MKKTNITFIKKTSWLKDGIVAIYKVLKFSSVPAAISFRLTLLLVKIKEDHYNIL
jgi:hypothetical protein